MVVRWSTCWAAVIGAVVLGSGACRARDTAPPFGAAGASNALGGAGSAGEDAVESASECANTTARQGYPYSCSSCEGLTCEPGDSCEVAAHQTGPGISSCTCMGSTFRCGLTARDPGGSGGTNTAGNGGANQGGAGASAGDDDSAGASSGGVD